MRLIVLLVALVVALTLSATAASKVTKYTFTGVTFSDGATNGIIYAGVKETNRSTLTNCGYHTEAGQWLGYYAASFASDDPDAVREFCEANFARRWT